MQPEDIDKLFRDQLQHHAPTPPAYLWEQLEEEIRPARKRGGMWLYAAAAVVALLILAGGGWLLRPTDSGTATGTLATTTPAVTPSTLAPATPEKKSSNAQATTGNGLSSNRIEDQPAPAVASTTPAAAPAPPAAKPAGQRQSAAPVQAPLVAQASTSAKTTRRASVPAPAVVPAPALAAAAQPERPAATDVAAVEPTVPTAPAPTGPIEVEVHRGTEAPVVVAAADAPQRYESDSHLKNLFHKAKTAVKEGRVKLPKVELPETVTVQVNVFNRTATKVIQL